MKTDVTCDKPIIITVSIINFNKKNKKNIK